MSSNNGIVATRPLAPSTAMTWEPRRGRVTPQTAGTPSDRADSNRWAAGLPVSVTIPAASQSKELRPGSGILAVINPRWENTSGPCASSAANSSPAPVPEEAGVPQWRVPPARTVAAIMGSQRLTPTRATGLRVSPSKTSRASLRDRYHAACSVAAAPNETSPLRTTSRLARSSEALFASTGSRLRTVSSARAGSALPRLLPGPSG